MLNKFRVAIGTDDGKTLPKHHYGDSKYFAIYDFTKDGYKFIELRVNKAAKFDEETHGDPRKFKAIIQQLPDVDVLVAWAMGPNYLRIRDNSYKIPYILKGKARKTREIKDALEEIETNFEKITISIFEKKKKIKE